jgi:hypothetical protein
MHHHRRLLSILTVALLAVGLTACGASGGDAATAGGDAPALAGRTVIAVADVDGDGRSDVLRFQHPSDVAPECWRSDEAGRFVARPDWRDHPNVRAVLLDARDRTADGLEADEGIHRARGAVSGGSPQAYAVLHVGKADEEVLGAPMIAELAPDTGDVRTLVRVHGTDLASRSEDTEVTFDGVSAEVLIALPRFVVAVVPAGLTAGDVDVVVTRGEEPSDAVSFRVVTTPTPVLTTLYPEPLVTGHLAVVRGTNLGTPLDDVEVMIGATEVPRFVALGRRLMFEVPMAATDGPLVVTVNGVASDGLDLEIAAEHPAPAITTLVPAAASVGSLVRIEGEHLFSFGDQVRVFFGPTEAAIFGFDRGSITAIVPAGAQSDDVTVEVGTRTSTGVSFTVLARSAPTITALTPSSGSPRALIEIEGTDLYDLSAWRAGHTPPFRNPFGDVEVRFNGSQAFVVIPTIDGLAVRIPRGATTGDVTVRVGIDTSNAVPFTVISDE